MALAANHNSTAVPNAHALRTLSANHKSSVPSAHALRTLIATHNSSAVLRVGAPVLAMRV